MGLGQAPRQGLLAESSQTKVMCLGSRFTLYYVLRKKKGETIIAAAWNARHMMGLVWKAQVDSKYKCNVFKATVQGALLSGLCAFARHFFYGSCTEDELFPLEACHNRLARRLFAMTRRNWDSEPKKGNFEKKKKVVPKARNCASCHHDSS